MKIYFVIELYYKGSSERYLNPMRLPELGQEDALWIAEMLSAEIPEYDVTLLEYRESTDLNGLVDGWSFREGQQLRVCDLSH